ncbi:cytochrome P450 [Streptomyces sp. NBC_00582]|uniref:cytochrome P450 n=1 Tax=Streptomyces sp. NBC_00582 TaxID=2975783 RepID=UPI001062992B|nr:cytochrome P450 [Streptomyces sp. NBC_00582]WUB59213.1 cytochrome P450 [Streptomyces sp. NBC_00582]
MPSVPHLAAPPPDPEDILAETTLRDPYPFFASLRRHDPVHWNPCTGTWYVTGYDDVTALLTDRRLGAVAGEGFPRGLTPAQQRVTASLERFFGRWLVFSDPPYQQHLRARLQPLFTPAAVAELAERIEDAAGRAALRLARAAQHGPPDLMRDFSRPFALDAVCELLGLTREEQGRAVGWSDALVGYLGASRFDSDVTHTAADAVRDLTAHVTRILLPRGSGAVARCLAPLLESGAIDGEEAAAVVAQLLTGGVEPVSTTIGVAVCARHACAGAASHTGEHTTYADAVEEALRYDAPFHFAPRRAATALTLHGRSLAAGDRVVLVLASANRDERVFAAPDVYDPTRPRARHVAFGLGGHYCLGAVLARTETAAALRALDREVPGLRVDPSAVGRAPAFGATVLRPFPSLV